jgi:uncharacterized membrane protein YukC
MNTIDISDLAFSLSNYSAVNEMLNSTNETIPEFVTETIPELVTETIPEFVSETIPELVTETIPEVFNNIISETPVNDQTFLYLGIGFIILTIIGIFTYNYYKNNKKNVRFQENEQQSSSNYQQQYRYQGSEI